MPLYNLERTEESSGADQVLELLSAFSGRQKRKSMQDEIYRRSAAGELQPSYEVDQTTGKMTVNYKPVNPKDAAEAALLQEKLKRFKGMGGGQGVNPYQQAVDGGDAYPKEYDEYGFPKSFGSRGADTEDRIQKLLEQYSKPVAGEVATKYAGGLQGQRNVDDIIKKLELSEQNGEVTASKKYKEMIRKMNMAGVKPTSYNVPLVGDLMNLITGGISGRGGTAAMMQNMAGEEGRDLELLFSLLAENQLRARTGAQSPAQELIREEIRTLAKEFDTPSNALNRLKQSRGFLHDVSNSIRPNYEQYVDPETGDVLPDKLQAFVRSYAQGQRAPKRSGVTSSGVGFTIEE